MLGAGPGNLMFIIVGAVVISALLFGIGLRLRHRGVIQGRMAEAAWVTVTVLPLVVGVGVFVYGQEGGGSSRRNDNPLPGTANDVASAPMSGDNSQRPPAP